MKTILIFLIPLILFGQDVKEYDSDLVFLESFTDEYTTRFLGSTPTDVTFSSGIGVWDGTDGQNIEYNMPLTSFSKTSTFSGRCRIKFNTSVQAVSVFRQGDYSVGYSFAILSDGKLALYVDGSNKSGTAGKVTADTWQEIVWVYNDGGDYKIKFYINGVYDTESSAIANLTTYNDNSFIMDDTGGFEDFDGELDYFEIYSTALTANQVLNLYNGVYYTPLVENWLFDVDTRLGVIQDNEGNTITNTSTTVEKHNQWSTAEFDGADSKLDMGYLDSLKGDITICLWMYVKSLGETDRARIVYNGQFYLYLTTLNRLVATSDAGTLVTSGQDFPQDSWHFVTVIREADGTLNYYSAGVASGASDLDSGTPVAGSANIIIGNLTGQTHTFDGYLDRVRIINSILTTAEIEQVWSSEKGYYK